MSRSTEPGGNALVIGVGNPARGDDGVGPLVVEALARRLSAGGDPPPEIVQASGDAAVLIDAWRGRGRVLVVDACRAGAPPGTVHRFEFGSMPGPTVMPAVAGTSSTHGLGLAEAIGIARALGEMPASLVVYAVEADGFEPGSPVSPAVAAAVEPLAARIGAELGLPEH